MKSIYGFDVNEEVPAEAHRAINQIFDIDEQKEETSLDESLNSALLALSKRLGFELKIPGELVGTLENKLYQIASFSEFRIQKMSLNQPLWWEKDSGPLLAIHRVTKKCHALIPLKSGGYITNDQVPVKIDKHNAQDFEQFVYGFFLPFPDRPITFLDILKLTLGTSRFEILSIFSSQLTLVFLALLIPILFGSIINSAIPLSNRTMLNQFMFGLIAASFSGFILTFLQSVAFLRVKLKSSNVISAALWERLLRIPLSFYRQYGTGEIIDRIRGLDTIIQSINANFLKTLLSGISSILSLGVIFFYDATVAGILIVIAFILTIYFVTTSLIQLYFDRKMQFIKGRSSSLLLQMISGIKKIRTSHTEKVFYNRWLDLLTKTLKYFMRANRIMIIVKATQNFVMIIATLIIYNHFVSVTLDPKGGGISLGMFITVNGLMGSFIASYVAFTTSLLSYIHLIPLYDRLKPVFEAIPEPRNREHIVLPFTEIDKIEFKNISFAYENTAFQTIKNLDLTIKKGQFIAFVGSSGSGKSTIIRLLLGLETPQEGKILYNGIDINQMPIQWIRNQCGAVLQSTNLVTGSLFDNITGFDNTKTHEDVEKAVHLANLTSDIKNFPMGLQTVVMENGAGLSLGQRQRILIARALCRHPQILIFDEATSALDSLNQKIIHENLDELSLTRIVVAHRLTTIQRADVIYVMHKGVLVESGTYQELIDNGGHFTKIMG